MYFHFILALARLVGLDRYVERHQDGIGDLAFWSIIVTGIIGIGVVVPLAVLLA